MEVAAAMTEATSVCTAVVSDTNSLRPRLTHSHRTLCSSHPLPSLVHALPHWGSTRTGRANLLDGQAVRWEEACHRAILDCHRVARSPAVPLRPADALDDRRCAGGSSRRFKILEPENIMRL